MHRSKKWGFFFFAIKYFHHFQIFFFYMSGIKNCLFYILFSSSRPSNFWCFQLENARNQMYYGFGMGDKFDMAYFSSSLFFFLIFHSIPVTAWLLSSSGKKKQHYFLSRSTAASGQTWLFFMCKKLTGSRLLRQTGDHPQPWECVHSIRISVLRGQKLSPTLPVTSKQLSQAACNPNQTTSDFRPSLGNLVIFLPLSDGKWQVEKKEEWKINAST